MAPATRPTPARYRLLQCAAGAVTLAIALACSDGATPLGPRQAHLGGASLSAAAAGDAVQRHFFFLPPMAPTGVYAGTFDSGRSPTVTVCPVATGGACGAPLATFRRSTAPGTETIRVDVVNQLYVANWRIDATKFPAGRTYRVVVADGPLALGSAEVSVVASQKAVRPGYSPVTAVVGSTLAVKFRLEVGAPFGVSADSKGTQTVSSPMTAEGTTASLALPAGSLTAGTTSISVKPVASAAAPASPVLVPGTVFDFGPDGTQFAAEVPLTITYDEAKLPRNVSEAALRMYFLNGRRWVRLPSTVSTATNSVVGMTSHFTTFGLLAAVHEVFVGTVGSDGSYVWPDTLIQAGQTRQYKAFVYDSAGTELTDRVVTWSVVDTLATVDSTGLMTARYPGLTMVVAESEGRTDTIRAVITPVPVQRVTITPEATAVAPGTTAYLLAKTYDAHDTWLIGRTIAWESSDPAVARVDDDGRVTGVANGTATITVTSEGVSATATVTVGQALYVSAVNGGTTIDQIHGMFIGLATGRAVAEPVTVTLTARDPRVVTVPRTVVIPAGASRVHFDAVGAALGTTVIDATAPGYVVANTPQVTVSRGIAILQGGSTQAVGERVQQRVRLPEGQMAVATTFALEASANVRFTDLAGNAITSITVPAKPPAELVTSTSSGFSPYFYVEAVAAGPAWIKASHPNFDGRVSPFTVEADRLVVTRVSEAAATTIDQLAYYTVSRSHPASAPVTVALYSGELRVPTSVVIPAGARSVTFGVAGSSANCCRQVYARSPGHIDGFAHVAVASPGAALLTGDVPTRAGERATAVLTLPGGPMAVATTFGLSAAGNVRFRNLAGNPITTITIPATDPADPRPVGGAGVSPAFIIEAVGEGPATVTAAGGYFEPASRSFTVAR